MDELAEKPQVDWDELHASTDFRELFRYTRGEVDVIYNLRILAENTAEVWVN